jgi:hypothetical protein
MDDFKWIGIIGTVITYSFYLLREIKEIFFDADHSGETFSVKIKKALLLTNTRKGKIKHKEPSRESDTIEYSCSERQSITNRLLIHNFFVKIDRLRNELPTIDFCGSVRKNIVLREIILIYLCTIEKHAKDFIKNNKLDELDTNELNDKLMSEVKSVEFDIYEKLKEKLGPAVYNRVVEDPTRGFKSRNSIYKEALLDGVMSISKQDMSYYGYDNYRRASEVLTSMYSTIGVIVKNFERVFKDFNGELEKLLEENK